MQKPEHLLSLIACLLVAFAAAAVGALATVGAGNFYQQLRQPDFAPPASVFGPVWSVLYALIGISAWRLWCRGGLYGNRLAFSLFFAQLTLNALWSWLFFAWHLGLAAFIDIVLLWLLISATVLAFWRVSRLAGLLLLPYLCWVTFAAALNFAIWQMNPGILG